jgi:protocatechuate 3,4-dioxygenase beta subunit
MNEDLKQGAVVTPERAMERVISRRRWLIGTAGALALAGVGYRPRLTKAQAATYAATPSMTEGPYFVDEKLNRSDIRTDPTTGVVSTGLPMYLGVTVSRIDGGVITPLTGAFVDVWHADAAGRYSDEAANSTSGRKFLRGYQVTGAHGTAKFLTVYPGWYSGRAVHIHCKVRLYSGSQTTYTHNTQFFFDESVTDTVYKLSPYNSRGTRDTPNARDGIYSCSTSAGVAGQIMTLRMSADGTHAVASSHVILNITGTNPGC